MGKDCTFGRFVVLLLAGGSVFFGGSAAAQTQVDIPHELQSDILVRSERMPAAEAPRSATCETLARNPYFAALSTTAVANGVLGPPVHLPTRMPRNPDYSAPPLVPVGSPLPTPPKSRFGTAALFSGFIDSTASLPTSIGDDSNAGANPLARASLDDIAAICRASYQPNGGSPEVTGRPLTIPVDYAGPTQKTDASLFRTGRDTSLPIALLLFDQRRFAESLPWFKKAVNKLSFQTGGDEAALYLGKLYLMGLGEQSDPAEGVRWLERAATARFNPITDIPVFDPDQPALNTASGEAAVILGNLYRTGYRGIPKDPQASRKWFDRAWDVGHVPAAKMLGDIYFDGADGSRDVAKAVAYYRRAAKLDLPAAQVALARILETGDDGVKRDEREAFAWYQAAARHENADALYALARAYDLGRGVKADPEQSIGLYKRAALAGNAAAMVALGTYFYEGKQVAKDDAIARRWFEQGAHRGDADGMVDLAAMQIQGQGGDKDMVNAWVWLTRAAALQHQAAPAAVAALERRMSPAERAAAQASLTRR